MTLESLVMILVAFAFGAVCGYVHGVRVAVDACQAALDVYIKKARVAALSGEDNG